MESVAREGDRRGAIYLRKSWLVTITRELQFLLDSVLCGFLLTGSRREICGTND
jgi:hypothetical protein